jgi:hypothetical protein
MTLPVTGCGSAQSPWRVGYFSSFIIFTKHILYIFLVLQHTNAELPGPADEKKS